MRVKELHPVLCCVALDSPRFGDNSPAGFGGAQTGSNADAGVPVGSDATVAGVLYKWTNYGKGWRSRWFLLRNGVLSYAKIRRPENLTMLSPSDVRMIGDVSSNRLSRLNSVSRRRNQHKPVVHLKISSFRESRSDDKRFYIFTSTKTLHLRTNTKRERVAWIEALVSTRSLFSLLRPLNDSTLVLSNDVCISTERLKSRLLYEGMSDAVVNDCEQIMLSEFSEIQGQLNVLYHQRSNLLDTLRQLEAASIETEVSEIHDSGYHLTKDELSTPERERYCEYSITESSDDIEKQDLEEVSDEEGVYYFDTNDHFSEPSTSCRSSPRSVDHNMKTKSDQRFQNVKNTQFEKHFLETTFPQIERRKKLPDPVEKEKAVSLWSIIKDNVGKDLTRVCLPVYFNEPISSLQKCFEDLEYSYLLDRAYEYGKQGNSLQRIVNVAAFAVSAYASSEGRHCKPFNPLLGETYEANYPEKGIRFLSEKVSHHPTLIACHCEGKGWKFWGDSNLRTKFWGRCIQLDPVGDLTLEFDDGEIFQWSKVTTTIHNLIFGKLYCDHHGMMNISGNRQYSCKLKFKEKSMLDRNPHQVDGIVEDVNGNKVATVFGKWDDSIYYVDGDGNGKPKDSSLEASLLWKRSMPPPNITRYNLTSFAMTLNELTPGLQEKLPPCDSRLRPDQRHLENGEYEKANLEKLRLEKRQRMSRKLQEIGWKPRWFEKEGEDGSYRYVGGYWEAREQGNWDDCADIFGEFNEELVNSSDGS